MVRILNGSTDVFCNSEQYKNCSDLLMRADDPPLEELDPAILSCGLPAIILSDIQPVSKVIRYTLNQLQAIGKSELSNRRPVVANDPRIARFAIWKTSSQLKRVCRQYLPGEGCKDVRNAVTPPAARDTPKEKLPERSSQKLNNGRENGYVAPRYRRNNEFSNRNQHVIVKSYKGEDFRLQEAAIEEEPEWMTGGPTSRLDTIELRGFDEDVSINVLSSSHSSLDKIANNVKNDSNGSEKHISFYDDLQHYEHVHTKRAQAVSKHDSPSRENDVESVATCTSSTNSPPPARSTPTKYVHSGTSRADDKTEGNSARKSQHNGGGIDVNNFEEFMKFDSLLSTDSCQNTNPTNASRFSKWFRRNGNSSGLNNENRRQQYHMYNDNYGNNYGSGRFQHEYSQPQRVTNASHNRNGFPSEMYNLHNAAANPSVAFKQFADTVAQNRASSNSNLLAQQQFWAQLLNKPHQEDFIRRRATKPAANNVSGAAQVHQTPPRIPTQRELQYHTQTIMQNALLRKKLQDQRKMFFQPNNQMSMTEANPAVQQFLKSVSPNIQRSLSVLSQTVPTIGQTHTKPSFGTDSIAALNNAANSNNSALRQHDLSASIQQLMLAHRSPGNGRRLGKGSTMWTNRN